MLHLATGSAGLKAAVKRVSAVLAGVATTAAWMWSLYLRNGRRPIRRP